MNFLRAFVIGGLICTVGQILIDKTKLTAARIMVGYVCLGAILGGLGVYEPFVKVAGAGATVPLLGFGNTLVKGVFRAVDETGFLGVFTGGLTAAAGGITAAVIFGYLFTLLFRAKGK